LDVLQEKEKKAINL